MSCWRFVKSQMTNLPSRLKKDKAYKERQIFNMVGYR